MLKVTIDGRETEVQNGATVMEAANRLGIYIPHFCYHKKLSIAANCRMCLVQIEKAPKPQPACATPVIDGMKVFTHSEYAKQAQDGVMEFLLINHPLDCPICDQGGECQLQDLAVGYGKSASRYTEAKRVVLNKNLGPLISTDMTRCIHCTRCVRFGQEVAGIMELGMAGRGEHAEILTFVGKTVDSELSGNVIDLCPVGALTSKPFRYTARTWELSRRRSVSPHDSLGSNLVVQIKHNRVMRVLPLENDELNECWLSDRDRFSYEGLNSEERIQRPMVKRDGRWQEVEWQVALEHVAKTLSEIRFKHDAKEIGALASPHSTLEEMALLAKLMRTMGSDNIDFRLRQSDFSADGRRAGAPWLGMKVPDLDQADRVLLVGSFLRKDHPLIAARLRNATRRGRQEISVLHCADDDLFMPVAHKAIVRPSELPEALAQVARALAEAKQKPVPAGLAGVKAGPQAAAIAASLASGRNPAILLGNFAAQHPQGAQLQLLAQVLAELLGGRFGFLGEAANSVGGYLAGCVPLHGGMNAGAMLEQPRRAYLLLNAEPDFDCHDPRAAISAMDSAGLVVALASYRSFAADYADVLLPVAPFTETSGTFVNCAGQVQSFNGVVRPLGEARPAWKVLRVLGNLMSLQGFDYESSEAVRDETCAPGAVASRLDNRLNGLALAVGAPRVEGLERIADVPAYFGDPIVRRAASLQRTREALPPRAWMTSSLAGELGAKPGERIRVRQGDGEAVVEVGIDERLPAGCLRLAAAHRHTAGLGPMFGSISVELA
ncbi:MAG TPA: NADH-quinone oxidoreductase subunit NuoG [Burkholderiales bacterium]|nr:NADH-quinone oxidoreductase subunit NuoG [Burkholderiales bacterium]